MTLTLSAGAKENLQVSEWYAQTSLIGFVLLFIVGVIASIVVLASIFTSPRRPKVTALFIASIILIVVGFTIVTYVMGLVFSLLLP